jgi:hypothetical protein
MESCEEIRAEALSLSHLTWDTTRTINLHIFGSTSFPVYGQNIIAIVRWSNAEALARFSQAEWLIFTFCDLQIKGGALAIDDHGS